ncbi:CCNT1 protein, partial [Halcyon senegalensis]|nr:CCNT1 protein [Halcyon senegalensis]
AGDVSLHLTTFSLQYTPPVVACVCIHLACKWSNWEIPVSTDGKHWWEYVDGTVTLELLDVHGLQVLLRFPVQQQLLWYSRDELNWSAMASSWHFPSWSSSISPVAPFTLTHEFLQILEKTPNRLKRIRNWRASQAARKSKADDHGDDENLSEQTILNMISRNNSSDMNIAGLMSMSTSSTAGAGPSLPPAADSPGDPSGADLAQPDHWHPPAKLELGQSHRTNESSSSSSVPEHPLQQDGAGYQKPGGKNAPAAKVSLKEYRAKHAEELAAQKRQLENMEANVRSQYAYAAQNLLVQQQREREVQQDNNPSPIILKLPLGSDNPERPPGPEKSDKASALKLRLPVAGGGGERPLPSKQEEIKMRIKVLSGAERHCPSDESGAKSREHKEKHKGHSSNHHHHHHNHHSHKHLHPAQLGPGPSSLTGKRPGDSKHGGGQAGGGGGGAAVVPPPHKSYGPLPSSRKRLLPDEAVAAATAHEHQPKVSKASKGPGLPFPYPHLPGTSHLTGHGSDPGNLPLAQATKARGVHGKADKGPLGANGHNANQASDYQDTVNMLHSLLSAQGMQPTPAPAFEFHSYGPELGNPRGTAAPRAAPGTTDKPRPPP